MSTHDETLKEILEMMKKAGLKEHQFNKNSDVDIIIGEGEATQ